MMRRVNDATHTPLTLFSFRTNLSFPHPIALSQEQRLSHFGTHDGITCDGCGATPLIGFRYRCRKCPNHDICDVCFERWDDGKGQMANGLAKQTISLDPNDHDFFVHKEKGFKPLVKTVGPTAKTVKKAKPNDPCPGGCGQKVKKCKC